MKKAQEYATATAFRMALEARLNTMAREQGIDVQRLRRQVTFDRLLCRLFHDPSAPWLLKGGYAMELRLEVARTTRDIDLSLHDVAALRRHEEPNEAAILDLLQDTVSCDLHDFFTFLVGEPMMDLEGAPYGGSRYPVDARLDGRTFSRFHVDVGLGDNAIEPLDSVRGKDWLGFAGIPAGSFPLISKEQQFAEKYHAYTRPRADRPNSRVRDLIDLVLLMRSEGLDLKRAQAALSMTFSKRKTHDLPEHVPPPPDDWAGPFQAMARPCRIDEELGAAMDSLSAFMDRLGQK
jgi:hypothetical protein